MNFFEYTNIGPRVANEDSFFIKKKDDVIFVCIADGVGGSKYGGFSSQFVTNKFEELIEKNADINLSNFIENVNAELIEESKSKFNSSNIGTTFTAGIIFPNYIKGVHIGDSRVCVLRGNGIKQITKEHTEVARLIREGKLDPNDKSKYPRKNILEKVLGNKDMFEFDVFEFELKTNDRIIFSTDGFHETIMKKEIRDISIRHKSHTEFYRQLKIELENRLLKDNTTFISVEI